MPAGTRVYNPAFDVTPAELIAGIISDRGVIRPVNQKEIAGSLVTTGEENKSRPAGLKPSLR